MIDLLMGVKGAVGAAGQGFSEFGRALGAGSRQAALDTSPAQEPDLRRFLPDVRGRRMLVRKPHYDITVAVASSTYG